jgi:hypothetical protein
LGISTNYEDPRCISRLMFKNSILTSKNTQRDFITKMSWLKLFFGEIITVCSESGTKPIHSLCGQYPELVIGKVSGTGAEVVR